jgi:hypothetical protein
MIRKEGKPIRIKAKRTWEKKNERICETLMRHVSTTQIHLAVPRFKLLDPEITESLPLIPIYRKSRVGKEREKNYIFRKL